MPVPRISVLLASDHHTTTVLDERCLDGRDLIEGVSRGFSARRLRFGLEVLLAHISLQRPTCDSRRSKLLKLLAEAIPSPRSPDYW